MKPPLRLPSVFYGFLMGCADIVPGISGGTVAFVMGFYEQLIALIKGINPLFISLLLRLRFKEIDAIWPWRFGLGLLSGFILAFALLSNFLNFLLNDPLYRVYLYSAFLGLIVASIVFCLKQVQKWHFRYSFPFILGVGSAWLLSGTSLMPVTNEPLYTVPFVISEQSPYPLVNYDQENQQLQGIPESTLAAMVAKRVIAQEATVFRVNDGAMDAASSVIAHVEFSFFDPWMIFCGAVAISAMLLPGISGSYMLTILGVYPLVIAAVADLFFGLRHLRIEGDALLLLGNMLIGIMLGAAVFSRLIAWLFDRYRDVTIVVLIGFMVGALRAVWPFWTVEFFLSPLKPEQGPRLQLLEAYLPDVSSPLFVGALLCASVGFLLVFILEQRATSATVN